MQYSGMMQSVMPPSSVILAEHQLMGLAMQMASSLKPGDILALEGEVGVGKTSLARTLIQLCCEASHVPSPTFSLVQYYPLPPEKMARYQNITQILHADFYRLSQQSESEALGLFDDVDSVVIVEWAERGSLFDGNHDVALWRIQIDELYDEAGEMIIDKRHYQISPPQPDRAG